MARIHIRTLWFTVLLALLSSGGAVNAATGQTTRDGVIQQLNFADGTLIVDGYRYHVLPDTQVEIAGSYGAFTMLEVGMQIHMVFNVVSSSRREVLQISQIPDNVMIEQV